MEGKDGKQRGAASDDSAQGEAFSKTVLIGEEKVVFSTIVQGALSKRNGGETTKKRKKRSENGQKKKATQNREKQRMFQQKDRSVMRINLGIPDQHLQKRTLWEGGGGTKKKSQKPVQR